MQFNESRVFFQHAKREKLRRVSTIMLKKCGVSELFYYSRFSGWPYQWVDNITAAKVDSLSNVHSSLCLFDFLFRMLRRSAHHITTQSSFVFIAACQPLVLSAIQKIIIHTFSNDLNAEKRKRNAPAVIRWKHIKLERMHGQKALCFF